MVKNTTAKTLAGHVYKTLRNEILAGQLLPGSRLQPATLAARLNTSTTVVRDALMQLVVERLCDRKPSYGFFVPTLSLQKLEDLTMVRINNDTFALEKSIERGGLEWETQVLSAHHLLKSTKRRSDDDPLHTTEEWATRHRAFHMALIAGCEIPLLLNLSGELFDSSELYRRWSAPSGRATKRDIAKEHEQITEAVLNKDTPLAIKLLTEHYTESMNVILEFGLAEQIVSS